MLASITPLPLALSLLYKSLLAGSWEAAANDSFALEHRKPPFNPPAVVCLSKRDKGTDVSNMPTVERICSEHYRKPVQSHITPAAQWKDNWVHFLKPLRTLCSHQAGIRNAHGTHHAHPSFCLCPCGSQPQSHFPNLVPLLPKSSPASPPSGLLWPLHPFL